MKTELTEEQKTIQANSIATFLGDGWTVKTDQDRGFHACWRTLLHPAGHGLNLSWRDGRLNVTGLWPDTSSGDCQYPRNYDDLPKSDISVSPDKPARTIAADISRRFLPPYLKAYTVKKQHATDIDTYEAKTAASVKALTAFGRTSNQNGELLYLHNNHVSRVSGQGDSVRFEAFSCPLPVALAVLELLRKEDE